MDAIEVLASIQDLQKKKKKKKNTKRAQKEQMIVGRMYIRW